MGDKGKMKLNIVSIPLIEFVVLWLICCTSANVSLKASPLRSSVDYEQMIKRIEAVQASKDMNKMEELAREIQTKWSKVDVDQYSTLMQNICRTMLFSSMGREKQTFPIVEKYSLLALQRKEEIPAATEANFVSYLLAQEGCYLSAKKLNNKDWTSYRVARASISLHALGRIAKKTDPNFDFSKIPLIHAIPPIGAMDNFETPEKIADPKLRSEYEAIIKANDATKAKYSRVVA